MKIIDEISVIKIKDVDMQRLKRWISEEIYEAADDFNQNLDQSQAEHIGKRLYQILSEKYRNWECGTIHAIFQKGIAGQYGKSVSKVTVANVVQWIVAEERLKRSENVTSDMRIEDIQDHPRFDDNLKKNLPFIRFCLKHDIDVSQLDPDLDPKMMQDRSYYNSLNVVRLRNIFNNQGEHIFMRELEKLPHFQKQGNVSQYMTI